MQLELNYRRADSQTSREAGDHARQFRSGDQALILSVLRYRCSSGCAEQISELLGWNDHVRVNRRLGELERAGLIIRTQERYINRSGRQAFKYTASR